MPKINAILINPFDLSITTHSVEADNIEDIYRLGGFKCFNMVGLSNGDQIYVDDEGWLDDNQTDADGKKRGFVIIDKHYGRIVHGPQLVGRGVILGLDHHSGESRNPITQPNDLIVAFFKLVKKTA